MNEKMYTMGWSVRLVVGGSRYLDDYGIVLATVKSLKFRFGITELWHGGARGADMLADRAGNELCMNVVVWKADWKNLGRRAGPIRTDKMLTEAGLHSLCVAFLKHPHECVGTKYLAKRANELGIPTLVVRS